MLSTFVVTDLVDLIDADILLLNFGHHSIYDEWKSQEKRLFPLGYDQRKLI